MVLKKDSICDVIIAWNKGHKFLRLSSVPHNFQNIWINPNYKKNFQYYKQMKPLQISTQIGVLI